MLSYLDDQETLGHRQVCVFDHGKVGTCRQRKEEVSHCDGSSRREDASEDDTHMTDVSEFMTGH